MNFLYSSKEMYMTKQTLHLHTWSTLKCQKVEMQFSRQNAVRLVLYRCVFKSHMGLSSSWKWKHWKLDYCFANSMILFPTEHITQREDVYALKKCLETISFYCEHNENLSDLFRLPASHLDSWSKVLVRELRVYIFHNAGDELRILRIWLTEKVFNPHPFTS